MKHITIALAFFTLAAGLTMLACGGAATSNNASNSNAANKTNTSSSPAANSSAANSAPAAKQGTPPKADFTMAADALHKEYVTMFAKDPNSIYTKYENKNIQISGKVLRAFPITTGSGVATSIALAGGTSTDSDATCSFQPETEESQALKVGDNVTLVGTQTHNTNGSTPLLEKCFVVKSN